jgi:hypothetical protein
MGLSIESTSLPSIRIDADELTTILRVGSKTLQ